MPGGWWLPDVRVLLFTKGFGVSEEQARTARKMGEHSTSTVRESHGNRTSTVRRVIGDWKIAASHLRTMILALKHVVQDFLRLFGLSTGLFCTHERNKCRCGRVTAEGGGVGGNMDTHSHCACLWTRHSHCTCLWTRRWCAANGD